MATLIGAKDELHSRINLLPSDLVFWRKNTVNTQSSPGLQAESIRFSSSFSRITLLVVLFIPEVKSECLYETELERCHGRWNSVLRLPIFVQEQMLLNLIQGSAAMRNHVLLLFRHFCKPTIEPGKLLCKFPRHADCNQVQYAQHERAYDDERT